MRVLILGADGYLGWPLFAELSIAGHHVFGADNFSRRLFVNEVGGTSAIPISTMLERLAALDGCAPCEFEFTAIDLSFESSARTLLEWAKPDCIVHLAENPSAPYSMLSERHAAHVQINNVVGTTYLLFAMRDLAPDAHLVKLGTLGEYGTPNMPIPEGFFQATYRGMTDWLPFPRNPGSLYHATKVADSINIRLACDAWGLKCTDLMQGPVYGTRTTLMPQDLRVATRLDFDECFGTVINRFVCQATVGHPLTVYGSGNHIRGFIPLRESIRCLQLVIEDTSVRRGEYRVFNQLAEVASMNEVASRVKQAMQSLGGDCDIEHLPNPRHEAAEHYYEVESDALRTLGYMPHLNMVEDLTHMLRDLEPHRERIMPYQHVMRPTYRWDGRHGSFD